MSANYSKNLHAILGVDEKAGPDELRKAYLHLAVKYHPDRNPGDTEAEERFKDISQAYAILSDPAARARYERLRARKDGAAKSSAGTGSASSRTAGARPSSAGTGAKARPSGASAGTAGRASASAGASAGTKSTSSGAGTGQSSTKSGTAGASSRAGAGASAQGERGPDSTGSAKNENFKSTGTSSSAERESADGDFDEILNNFFKTDKGRETLRDLEGELGKAGIKFKAEDFAQWVKEKQQPPKASTSTEKRGGSLWHKLTSWLPGSEAREQKKAERYDINYQITITPQVAATGTTVEISYQRDDKPHRLSIKIPAGTRDGARLRLGEQGRLKPDQTRGALILTVQVQQPQTVADLWR